MCIRDRYMCPSLGIKLNDSSFTWPTEFQCLSKKSNPAAEVTLYTQRSSFSRVIGSPPLPFFQLKGSSWAIVHQYCPWSPPRFTVCMCITGFENCSRIALQHWEMCKIKSGPRFEISAFGLVWEHVHHYFLKLLQDCHPALGGVQEQIWLQIWNQHRWFSMAACA